MSFKILTEQAASISEFKKNPMAALSKSKGSAMAILNRNKPAFYCVPPELYEMLLAQLEQVEDLELGAIALSRKNEKRLKVNLDDL